MKFGKTDLLQIFYHPITKKHLGLAKIIFEEAAAAKSCVQRLNDTSVMGKVVNVFMDPFGKFISIFYMKIVSNSKGNVQFIFI